MTSLRFEKIATLIFVLAITHAFITPNLYIFSRKLAARKKKHPNKAKFYHFSSEVVYLLSEIEVVFGIWLIPLLLFFTMLEGFAPMLEYLNGRNYSYPLFIMVVVVVMGSRPIITFAERILEFISRLGKDSPGSWWWTILTVGPILGALLKEPGAMTLCAILLAKKFYQYKPSRSFQYATFALLFANISVGGMLTSFSSRSLLIVAGTFKWDTPYMFMNFGWKALVGIVLANAVYYMIFRKEFKTNFPKKLPTLEKDEQRRPVPFVITLVHLLFLTAIVLFSAYAPLFIGVFFLFLGFRQTTLFYQGDLHLKSAILVGFFFASLLIHGELQGWWIKPFLDSLSEFGALIASFALSAFVDNAAIATFSLELSAPEVAKQHAIISGAMAAGALTIVANVPNPIGLSILRESFHNKISFATLFLFALFPSFLFLTLFWLL